MYLPVGVLKTISPGGITSGGFERSTTRCAARLSSASGVWVPNQTVGRAARNADARVILYADVITDSMKSAMDETERRRKYQTEYNKAHGIVPKTVKKEIKNAIVITQKTQKAGKKMTKSEVNKEIERLTGLMKTASAQLDFETAITLREEIAELKKLLQSV